jgi:predicted MFS family arabinose efflux permease
VTLGQTTGDWVDQGFDYTTIRQIGIKFGTGTTQSALYSYDGPVYVDEYEVVPEPASIMLFATGLLGLLGAGFKKRI